MAGLKDRQIESSDLESHRRVSSGKLWLASPTWCVKGQVPQDLAENRSKYGDIAYDSPLSTGKSVATAKRRRQVRDANRVVAIGLRIVDYVDAAAR